MPRLARRRRDLPRPVRRQAAEQGDEPGAELRRRWPCTACCTCSATTTRPTTARCWRRQDGAAADLGRWHGPCPRRRGRTPAVPRSDGRRRPGDVACIVRSLNYAFEGIIYVAPHAAEHARALRRAGASRSSLALALGVHARRAAGADDRGDRFVLDRGDAQHGARGRDRRRHDLASTRSPRWRRTSPPARCWSAPSMRRRRSATWCSPSRLSRPDSTRADRAGARVAGAPDGDRAGAGGAIVIAVKAVDGPRHAAARRPAVAATRRSRSRAGRRSRSSRRLRARRC